MKKVVFGFSLIILSTINLNGQCNSDNLANACILKLDSGFNFLKSYKVDGNGVANNKVEYSYVFTKGTQYMINLCTNGSATTGIVVTVYDSKRNKVATNKKIDKQYVSAITYRCSTTGIYYIQYTFDNSSEKCGGSALGFKHK